MLIPKQLLGIEPDPKPKPQGGLFGKVMGMANQITEAAKKLPTPKRRVETEYGTIEVETKAKWTRNTRQAYKEMLEEQGRKEGWKRKDGTVYKETDSSAIFKTTPQKQKQLANDFTKFVETQSMPSRPSVIQTTPEEDPTNPAFVAPRERYKGLSAIDRSAAEAYDRSLREPTWVEEYTGGDPSVVLRNAQGQMPTKNQMRGPRRRPSTQVPFAPKSQEELDAEEFTSVSDQTLKNLVRDEKARRVANANGQPLEGANWWDSVSGILQQPVDKLLLAIEDGLLQPIIDWNEKQQNPDPTISLLGEIGKATLYPGEQIANLGNLYDPTATTEERLGAIGNTAVMGLGTYGSLNSLRGAANTATALNRAGKLVGKGRLTAGQTARAILEGSQGGKVDDIVRFSRDRMASAGEMRLGDLLLHKGADDIVNKMTESGALKTKGQKAAAKAYWVDRANKFVEENPGANQKDFYNAVMVGTDLKKPDGALNQIEGLYDGSSPLPQGPSKPGAELRDAATFLQEFSRRNPVFTKPIKDLTDAEIVDGIVKHSEAEIDAWLKTSPQYRSFYGADITQVANPQLQQDAVKRYGRNLTDAEVDLYHLLSGLASPQNTPINDSSVGLQVLDNFFKTGKLDARLIDAEPQVYKKTLVNGIKKTKSPTGSPAPVFINNRTGVHTYAKESFGKPNAPLTKAGEKSLLAMRYYESGLPRIQHLIDKYGVDGAMEWLRTKHTPQDIMKEFNLKPGKFQAHEYLDPKSTTPAFGIFGIGNVPKLGSYVLNRWQEFGTITKDMWVARTMARMTGDPLITKGAKKGKIKVLAEPWSHKKPDQLRLRKALDEAWERVAVNKGMSPAEVQEAMWDIEQSLYGKLGVPRQASYVSEGLQKGINTLNELETSVLNQSFDGDVKGWYDRATKTIGLITGKSDFTTAMHESFHAWTDGLTQAHKDTLAEFFGPEGSLDWYEGSARAFEKYVKTGEVADSRLGQIFEDIKTAIKSAIDRVKGTPTEEAINPEVRRVFDEMLGRDKPKVATDFTPDVSGIQGMRVPNPRGTGVPSSIPFMQDMKPRLQPGEFTPTADSGYATGNMDAPVDAYLASDQNRPRIPFKVNSEAKREGFAPAEDTNYSTDPVQSVVSSYIDETKAKQDAVPRQQRVVSLTNDLIENIKKRKEGLRKKSSDYRRLDILQKEVEKSAREGTIHPMVDDLMAEYDQKMGLSQPQRTTPTAPVVEPTPVAPVAQPVPTPKATKPAAEATPKPPAETPQVKPRQERIDNLLNEMQSALKDKTPEGRAKYDELQAELRKTIDEVDDAAPDANPSASVPKSEPTKTTSTDAPKKSTAMNDLEPKAEPPRTTGISNAANLTDFEQGLISSAPEGKGRSVKEIIETNKDRKDFDNVANRVAKGESLTADNAAALLIGKAEYTKQVRSAKDALEKAIADGAKQSDIDDLRESLDTAIENATKFAEKVQRGKSEWSDIGRTLATMLNYDTRKIETVLQEARLKKGAKLTQDEIDDLTAKVNDLLAEDVKNKAEIERLMKAHADNAAQVAATRKIARTPEARAAKRKQALDEFLSASSGLNAYVNPKVIKEFAKYMYTLIEDGARSVDDIIAAAAKDGVKADVEDVYAAMRSKIKEPTLSDLQKEIAKTKRELMADAKAADPGFVEDARQKKIQGMEDQIAKLKKQAEDGTLPAPKKKQVDDQIKALEEERRKALKEAQDASPEYQASLLEKDKERLRAKLAGLEDRIKRKDYAEKTVIKQAMRTDDELDKLRQQVRVKDKIIQAAVEGARPKTNADIVGNALNEIKLWNVAARVKDFGANTVKGADFAASSLIRRGVDIVTAAILKEDRITKGTNLERTQRVLNKSKNRLKADAELIIKGADPDSVKKYGSFKGPGGKAAGLTDVPFKSFYYEWMSDAAADYKARQILGKGADPVDVATKREEILANLDEHPDIQLMAEEYALNQTLNNSNWASETVGFLKKKAGNTGAVFVDETIGRFSKVITNVAIDATDRTGIGIIRGGAKIAYAKSIGKTLSVSERAIINDMITKGATGLATISLGYFLGDKVIGTIKGERGKYIDFGDIEGIGGPIAPFLVGATYKKSESIKDPEEAAALRLTTILRLPINTPLASNTKDLLNALTDASSTVAAKKFLARKLSNVFIPGVVRDSAERMDAKGSMGILTGAEIEREKIPKVINPKTKNEVQTKDFFEILKGDVKSKIPFLRQQLPVKKTAEDKKKEAANKKREAKNKKALADIAEMEAWRKGSL